MGAPATPITVEDFDQFLSVFTTKGSELRGQHGSRGAQVYRNVRDPNEVTVVFDWDPEDFREFMTSPEGRSVMQEAGLQGQPDPVFLEHVTETSS